MIITALEWGLLGSAFGLLWYAVACYRESCAERDALVRNGENGILKMLVANAVRRDIWLIWMALIALAWAVGLICLREDLGLVAISSKGAMLAIVGGACVMARRDSQTRSLVLRAIRDTEAQRARETAAGAAR